MHNNEVAASAKVALISVGKHDGGFIASRTYLEAFHMNVAQVCQVITEGKLLAIDAMADRRSAWRDLGESETDGKGFVTWLVLQQRLTEFQGEAIVAGLTGPFMLGPYRVYERIALGRLGHIFRAIHEEFNQPVALKVFPSALTQDPERQASLAREARVAIQVDHPNVLRTYQLGRINDITFLAFEDMRGETLRARLDRENILPHELACRFIYQAALGLEHLHGLDIVHRDLEPDNIWITANEQAKIMEFSAAHDALAYLESLDRGEPKRLLGDCDYLAAEAVLNPDSFDPRSDIYSLGCISYRCLTGQPLFPESDVTRKMLQHALASIPNIHDFAPTVPHSLLEVVQTMLAKKPEDRYHRASDLLVALSPFIPEGQTWGPTGEAAVNEDYLGWVYSHEGRATTGFTTAVASPEFFDFIEWMAKQPVS